MFNKFFGSKQTAKSDSNGSTNGSGHSSHDAPPPAPRSYDSRPRVSHGEPSGAQWTLLALEDVYRATGLIDLRTGYNIQKVVDMLHNSHIRNLPDEMRRASILMALDAASIPVEDVLRDARLRLEALSKYESEQQKRLQEYEAQKLQENAGIQSELEQVTEHYKARMKSNLDDVSRLRDPFVSWQSTKQDEVQRISEAVALCSKRAEMASAAVADARPGTEPVASSALSPAATSAQPAIKA